MAPSPMGCPRLLPSKSIDFDMVFWERKTRKANVDAYNLGITHVMITIMLNALPAMVMFTTYLFSLNPA